MSVSYLVMGEFNHYKGREYAYLQPGIKELMKECLKRQISQPELVEGVQEQPVAEQVQQSQQVLETL